MPKTCAISIMFNEETRALQISTGTDIINIPGFVRGKIDDEIIHIGSPTRETIIDLVKALVKQL